MHMVVFQWHVVLGFKFNFFLFLGSSETLEDTPDETRNASSPDHRVQQRTNATIHVCWHRSVSVGMQDHTVAIRVRTDTDFLVSVLIAHFHMRSCAHSHANTHTERRLLFHLSVIVLTKAMCAGCVWLSF